MRCSRIPERFGPKQGAAIPLKKQEQKNKTVFHAVAALLAVLAVVLVLYGGGRWLEKRAEKPETRTQLPQADQETVEVDGVTYRKKNRLTTIVVRRFFLRYPGHGRGPRHSGQLRVPQGRPG